MNRQYDAIIIGGGHNGLAAAAALAKAGKQVLVLEKRHVLGGAAATEAVFPGFKVDTGAADVSMLPPEIVQALFLKMHGLEIRESEVALFAPLLDGRSLTLWRDVERNVEEIGRFSHTDAEKFPTFTRQVNRMAGVLKEMMLNTPPDVMRRNVSELMAWGKVGLKVKRLGRQEMMTFLRILPMSVMEYLDEWFETDALKGALGATAVTGLMQGPRAAGTTLTFLYQQTGGFLQRRTVLGGVGQLSAALATAAQQNGVEIRTGAGVARVVVENGAATGVALESGETIGARVVLSSADPRRTFFDLVGGPQLTPRFMRHVRNIIYRGSTARVNLALDGVPQFMGQTDERQLHGRIVINPSLNYLEKAYDAAKYGRISERPYLDVTIPSLIDPTLAPAGQHVMGVTMKYAPYDLRGDWDAEREALGDHIVDTLAEYAPQLKEMILHRRVITPLDWEREYSLTEGSIYHGQMTLDQLLVMRPVPGWGQYRTPIENLYLCGAGAHPGGGVTGAPGYNAARAVLQALK